MTKPAPTFTTIPSKMNTEEWRKLPRPVWNCCANCAFEKTCGYSPLATCGERDDEFSSGPCILGLLSTGNPFFQTRENV